MVEVDGIESGVAAPTAWPNAYTAPQIERYDDIADIMMMDPIHEVDKTLGWPRTSVDEPRDSYVSAPAVPGPPACCISMSQDAP